MNDKTRRALESAQRCRTWIEKYTTFIPGGSLFEAKCMALTAKTDDLESLTGHLNAAASEGKSATDLKTSERGDLIEVMEAVRNAARAADADHPGTRDRYRYTANMSDEDLLAAGRSFAEGAATDTALLTGYGAPAGWPADVTAACDAFEASFGQQDSALGERVATNAQINQKLDEITQLKRTIGHMVPNFCAADVGAIAAWHTAAHVENAPKTKTTPPTP